MARLLQLVLGIAIHCDGKERKFVQWFCQSLSPDIIYRVHPGYHEYGPGGSTRGYGGHPTGMRCGCGLYCSRVLPYVCCIHVADDLGISKHSGWR